MQRPEPHPHQRDAVDAAVAAYVDALLGTFPARAAVEAAVAPLPAVAAVAAAAPPASTVVEPERIVAAPPEPEPEPAASATEPKAEVVAEAAAEPLVEPLPESPTPVVSAPPYWRLTAAGLQFAIPGEAVAAVLPWPDDADALEGPVAVGLTFHDEFPLWIADLAAIALPADRLSALPAKAERLRHVVVLKGTDWALAVAAEPEALDLGGDAVTPRSATGTRRWLAGTVLARGLAVLDVAGLKAVLAAHKP